MPEGRKILVGITGGIAAYKTASLIRLLVQDGNQVKVIMTDAAKAFISPLTISVLSKNPVFSAFFDSGSGQWNSHIELGSWADLFIVAPATANTIAKMAYGIADNLLLATYLAARCPVIIAPSMDIDMLNHRATTENIAKLKSRGVHVIDSPEGELASGLTGKGRMMEPEDIVSIINEFPKKKIISL